MDLILCHTTADFDALGAAVGLCVLRPGSRIVLTGGCHPTVRDFLALHRDEYPLIERRSVNPKHIRSLTVVDTGQRHRLGKAAQWLDLPYLEEITLYDHHPNAHSDIPATHTQIEPVGATTTLIVEKLRASSFLDPQNTDETHLLNLLKSSAPLEEKLRTLQETLRSPTAVSPRLTPAQATVMALGIHVDTGSLTFDQATPRDATALAWLMEQGVSLGVVAEYIDPGLSPQLQDLLTLALDRIQTETLRGYTVGRVLLTTDSYVPGLSSLATRLIDLTETDALLLANSYPLRDNDPTQPPNSDSPSRFTVIGRSRIPNTNLSDLFKPLGGGGHPRAASLTLREVDPQHTLETLTAQLRTQIPRPPSARELMSSPVRTIRPQTPISEAHRILLRYGHSGLCIVEAQNSETLPPQLMGIISRRDIDIALHHGFSHAPVKGYMTPHLQTITPETLLPEIEALMVTYDIGRLPVLENGQLVGIVTRTDVLRELHQQKEREKSAERNREPRELPYCPLPGSILDLLQKRLAPQLWQLLSEAATLAEQRGWQLYLVGGIVRDLLLAKAEDSLMLTDIDVVVEGCHEREGPASESDAGKMGCHDEPSPAAKPKSPAVKLAKALQKRYPAARLEVHGQFQTAALLWHKHPELGSLWVDIATARTEFYPYPAANPEVEASSIRQDLYRRDFTINALAVRLSSPRAGELLDFFGGLLDLQGRQIRVLHANSFIEDPTRIFRAVRFAVRLGFEIEPQTEEYIRHAVESGIYYRVQAEKASAPALETRLKTELKSILQAPYGGPALQKLGRLGALRCLHPTLELNQPLWRQLRLANRCLLKLETQNPAKLRNLPDWQLRLEVLLASLAPEDRHKVASNLQLPGESLQRLQHLETWKAEVTAGLRDYHQLSQWVALLRGYELPALILIAVQSPKPVRRRIWEYLSHWAFVEAPLNGNDLKALGYRPGPQFKPMLENLLAAFLDGEVRDRTTALSFLAQHYPLQR